ncbi:hypothetical protein XthCFBP4691_19495 [Xanthomonas theicola]|uniref:Uncharacterized protein n=2 Tax=Xanthomonas theicola TaxID=56464 RepID=A0A2S6Z5U9_9XANT|nr:hypothetical protein XthCFBP4691_19495 [Xanthomonas theicola]
MPDTTGVPDSALAAQVIEDVQPKDAFSDESGYAGQPGGVPGANGLDTQGYGWSRSCPTPPTVNLMGQSITFDITPFCNWMALGGWLVLIFASFLSVRILSSSSSGSV